MIPSNIEDTINMVNRIHVPTDANVLKGKFQSINTMKSIAEFVEKETSTEKIQLFFDKNRANAKSCLGDLCSEGSCKLFAVEAKDVKRRDAYLEI